MPRNTKPALILVLGDQLTPSLSSLAARDPASAHVLIAEVMGEATYVWHHKKKIAFLFSAMRHFAVALQAAGWTVHYTRLDDAANTNTLKGEVVRVAKRVGAAEIVATEPGEWRVLEDMRSWGEASGLPLTILPDTRFICSHERFRAWAGKHKQLRMEFFYREMRRETALLMKDGEPEGGRWNFDAENRKRLPKTVRALPPKRFEPDAITRDVLALVGERFASHPGALEPFWFAVTRAEAQAALKHFLKHALPQFGDYQDAMRVGEPTLFHSVLAPYINCGLLDPLEVCRAVEAEYVKGRVPLNAAEGFIRQIIGWREYVRGIYWMNMPGYERSNVLGATRPLPAFYWTGDTEMACVSACVRQTLEEAYAHHIQRLMVTGLFALLAGVDPHALHEWYLAVYADAYEWVELPNTVGMSQFADGGLLASKPYAASGAYINRMSDYCSGCAYDVDAKTGAKACPFNYLYWDFLARHRERLSRNPRLGQMYRSMDGFPAERRAAIEDSAKAFLAGLKPETKVEPGLNPRVISP
ncbi:MAG: cryptochrome/photolyase family protein [Micropepsaceae bacterium]